MTPDYGRAWFAYLLCVALGIVCGILLAHA